jgi:hypothetical protein
MISETVHQRLVMDVSGLIVGVLTVKKLQSAFISRVLVIKKL